MTIKYLSESEVIEVFEAGIEVLVCEDEYGVDFSISDGDYSLRDVQAIAGHSSLAMTQLYIAADEQAKRKIVELV